MVQQHSGADSRFKVGSILRQLWNNSLPVLISQLIYQMDYAVLGVLVLSEEGRQELLFLLRPSTQLMGISSLRGSKQKAAESATSHICISEQENWCVLFVISCLRR